MNLEDLAKEIAMERNHATCYSTYVGYVVEKNEARDEVRVRAIDDIRRNIERDHK